MPCLALNLITTDLPDESTPLFDSRHNIDGALKMIIEAESQRQRWYAGRQGEDDGVKSLARRQYHRTLSERTRIQMLAVSLGTRSCHRRQGLEVTISWISPICRV